MNLIGSSRGIPGMHLTLSTDYALRTLIYLGLKGDRLSTIAEIAERFAVSRTHLMKVVNKLVHHGHVTALRGRGGGLTLARTPGDISVGAIVRETEEELA